jgi:UDP-N-acetyl-D-mannosaminuronate dehydrogenase
VKESAYSTTRLLIPELERSGAIVWVNDPLFSDEEISAAAGAPLALEAVERVDAIIIQAYHREYDALGLGFFNRASVVLDGRAALDPSLFTGADVTYLRIGTVAAPSLVGSSI